MLTLDPELLRLSARQLSAYRHRCHVHWRHRTVRLWRLPQRSDPLDVQGTVEKHPDMLLQSKQISCRSHSAFQLSISNHIRNPVINMCFWAGADTNIQAVSTVINPVVVNSYLQQSVIFHSTHYTGWSKKLRTPTVFVYSKLYIA